MRQTARSQQAQPASESQTTILPHGRKLPAAGGAPKSPVQRFFEAFDRDPAWCCYGIRETLRALRLYLVDELLVCEESLPAELDIASLERLASTHKASRMHRISVCTVDEREFCGGFRVAGLLSRPMESVDEAEDLSPLVYSPRQSHVDVVQDAPFVGVGLEEVQESSNHAAYAPMVTPKTKQNSAHMAFFTWLERALRLELPDDEMQALALLDCVHVILGAQHEQGVHECLESAAALLAGEALCCAGELMERWYAAHLAESGFELLAVEDLQVGWYEECQLRSDETMARRLQAEEDAYVNQVETGERLVRQLVEQVDSMVPLAPTVTAPAVPTSPAVPRATAIAEHGLARPRWADLESEGVDLELDRQDQLDHVRAERMRPRGGRSGFRRRWSHSRATRLTHMTIRLLQSQRISALDYEVAYPL